ncbi:hypothetical protein [Candidatus Nitrospira salsa]
MVTALCLTIPVPSSYAQVEPHQVCTPFDWNMMPANEWVNVSTCGDSPRKVFHGASTLAADRRTVFFFGADTHDKDYDNSVYRFSLTDLRWSQDYEADSLETYRVTLQGYPATSTNRPWAMHAFDGWDYDPTTKTLVLVGFPKHATQAIQQLKDRGKLNQSLKPSTWHYNPDTRSWKLIQTQTPQLFAGGFAWDPSGKHFIGHDGQRTYHYDPQSHKWDTHRAPSIPGYHLRLVYDTFTNSLLSLGNNYSGQELWSYSSQSTQWERIKVNQPPLPANGAAVAYGTHHHVLLYLANDGPTPYENSSGKSATFLYKSQRHQWERLPVKSPPLFGMNYLTQYDPVAKVFLHFEKPAITDEHIAVWAFRYRPTPSK